MKKIQILNIFLISIAILQAGPYRRHHHHPGWHPYAYENYYPSYDRPYYTPYYSCYYSPYWSYQNYTPLIVSTRTTTTYPRGLVMVTANSITDDLAELKNLNEQGILTDKEFNRAKKTLLNRIGMSINPEAAGPKPQEILQQIRVLHQMQSRQLLTAKEFRKEKYKLLALL